MENLKENGYIVQRASKSGYRGIDGDNWYLNYCSADTYFANFHTANIDNSFENPRVVECCTDVEYLQRYMEESKNLGISFRLLLCSTSRPEPVLGEKRLGLTDNVLGFDIAYSGGSYYSCVLNDIVSGRIPEFQNIRLNENGLFSSYEEAEAFMKQREELEKATTEYIYEKGDYVIYMLTEVSV